VHPVVIEEFRAGTLAESWTAPVARLAGLDLAERRLLALLEGTARARRGRATAAKAA
jgi:hypothetical protein